MLPGYTHLDELHAFVPNQTHRRAAKNGAKSLHVMANFFIFGLIA